MASITPPGQNRKAIDLGVVSHASTPLDCANEARWGCETVIPRKEVIQPHLPVRLPCYDFTPITDPTLDACLPKGLAQRLQVLPAFVV